MPGMQTFTDIIDAWPSRQILAEDLQVGVTKIAVWRHRRSIPPAHWLALVEAARHRGVNGVSLEDLARIAAERAERPIHPSQGAA